jgi:MYXO-CTERM domain-containing protein
VPTIDETTADTDGDGVPNYLDKDSDGDGVDDGVEFGLDDDCDDDPDHLDDVFNAGLCDTAAFTTSRYERQPECGCSSTTGGAWGLLALLPLAWMRRKRA